MALALGSAAAVSAQTGATLESFRPARSPADAFGVNGGDPGKHLELSLQLYLDYANDPLVYEDVGGDADTELVALVSDQLTMHALASLGIYDVAMLFVGLPINLLMSGEVLGEQPTATGFGAGDLLLGGRLALHQSQTAHVAVALSATAPTGEAGENGRPSVAGDAGATLAPAVTADVTAGPLSLLFDVGMRFRPDARFSGSRFRDVATFGVALSLPLDKPLLRAILETAGESPLDDFGERAGTQLQALLGLRLHTTGGLGFGLAGGAGLLRGYGSPDVRGVLTVAYTHSLAAAKDTQANEDEPPPVEQEPASEDASATPSDDMGEPLAAETIADSDGDGAPDLDDRCPVLPGTLELSGCPRTIRYDEETGAIELVQAMRFQEGSKRLHARADEVLAEVAAALQANPAMQVRVEAHVSRGRGDPQVALELSRDRAEAAALRLIELGVSAGRLTALGCGANRPLVPDSGSQRFKNERVELYVTEPLPPAGMRSTLGCAEVDLPGGRAPKALDQSGRAAPAGKPSIASSPAPTAVPAAPKPAAPPPPPPPPPPPAAAAKPPLAAPAPKPAPGLAAATTAIAVLTAVAGDSSGDSDRDGIANGKDECPLAPGAKGTPPGCPPGHRVELEKGSIELLKPLRFDDGASGLSGRSDELLDELAATLKANPKMKVRIEGHTGEDPSPDASSALSQKRAVAVRKALASRGVAPTRMLAYGCGQNRPIAPNNVPWGRKKNERIELHVLDPAPSSAVQSTTGCTASE